MPSVYTAWAPVPGDLILRAMAQVVGGGGGALRVPGRKQEPPEAEGGGLNSSHNVAASAVPLKHKLAADRSCRPSGRNRLLCSGAPGHPSLCKGECKEGQLHFGKNEMLSLSPGIA